MTKCDICGKEHLRLFKSGTSGNLFCCKCLYAFVVSGKFEEPAPFICESALEAADKNSHLSVKDSDCCCGDPNIQSETKTHEEVNIAETSSKDNHTRDLMTSQFERDLRYELRHKGGDVDDYD